MSAWPRCGCPASAELRHKPRPSAGSVRGHLTRVKLPPPPPVHSPLASPASPFAQGHFLRQPGGLCDMWRTDLSPSVAVELQNLPKSLADSPFAPERTALLLFLSVSYPFGHFQLIKPQIKTAL